MQHPTRALLLRKSHMSVTITYHPCLCLPQLQPGLSPLEQRALRWT